MFDREAYLLCCDASKPTGIKNPGIRKLQIIAQIGYDRAYAHHHEKY